MIPQLNHRIRVRTPEVYSWFWHQCGKSLPQHALKNGNSSRTLNTEKFIALAFENTGPPPAPREWDPADKPRCFLRQGIYHCVSGKGKQRPKVNIKSVKTAKTQFRIRSAQVIAFTKQTATTAFVFKRSEHCNTVGFNMYQSQRDLKANIFRSNSVQQASASQASRTNTSIFKYQTPLNYLLQHPGCKLYSMCYFTC